ncbi:PAS domain S-box protein [Nitrospirota bacterium]
MIEDWFEVNDTFAQMLGYERDELIGVSFKDITYPEDLEGNLTLFDELIAGKRDSYQYEKRYVTKDKRIVWGQVNSSLIELEGASEKYLVTVVKDITDRKMAEHAIIASEKKYRLLLENTETGFVSISDKGIVLEANEPYLKIVGVSRMADVLGHSVLEWTAPESLERNAEAIAQCVEQGYINDFETTYLQPDDTRCVIQIDAIVQDTTEGKTIISFCRNISQRKKDEEQSLRAVQLESLGLLAEGIAHDFNNKLGTILNNVTLAKSYLDPGQKAFEKLTDIEKTYWQTTHLTNQLMTFSKSSPMLRTVFSLDNLLRDTVDFVLSGSSITSEFHIPADLLLIEADKGQISQVISNIVLNAKESMNGNGEVKVIARNIDNSNGEVLVESRGVLVKVTIEDIGQGVSEENLKRIFDPFFSSKDIGRGIGLSTSYSIIHRHNGLIEAKSIEGKGAAFTFYLPSTDKSVPYVAGPAEWTRAERSLNILLMDDEKDFRESLGEILYHLGHKVEMTSCGEDALDSYARALKSGKSFDLVILDMTIQGGMGGLETFDELKKMDTEVSAIVSSGYSSDMIDSEFESKGFIGSLMKPYGIDQLQFELQKIK